MIEAIKLGALLARKRRCDWKWDMGSGKWDMGSGKWDMGSGKWEVGIWKREMKEEKAES